ncbi:Septin-domain-containing protein [Phaeosphaeriaceae sp. PMI808]|nr:Septin-domain-containing protein [Phaeosphaeriaceae sp. PMI808]
MRPLPRGDTLSSPVKPRSRKSSVDHAATASSHVPITFFMRSEEEIEQSLASSSNVETPARQRDSTFGVQSLADTLEAAFGEESPDSSKSSPSRPLKRKVSSHAKSTRPTPLTVDAPSSALTPAMPSTPSAVSILSLKLSDEESAMDESASQAIASSEEEDNDDVDTHTLPGASDSFPQLVMPSIQMPSRRPFTTKGKAMGKLKIMVAGEAGLGKTSLVRSIVQLCEDIVHVDPLSPSNSFSRPPPPTSKSRRRRSDHVGTTRITEIHGSTKPYPHWWTDTEESRVPRRRKSSLDGVLERNICFVDTPGFSRGPTEKEEMDLVVDYVESLLLQTSSVTTMEDSDVLGVVSGNGGVSIDVVLYLLPPNKDISTDIAFMQRLSSLTNVIPVIAKADTLSAQEAIALKTSVLARLQTTPIKPFLFGKALDDSLLAVQSLSIIHPQLQRAEPEQYPFTNPTYPYTISTISGPDNETMDASLLMSPDYVQPLLPSELSTLVNQVFEPDSIAWLRHSAAKRFLAWRRIAKLPADPFILQSLQQPRSPTTASIGLNGAAMNCKINSPHTSHPLTPSPASANSSLFSAVSPSGVLVPRSTSPLPQEPSQPMSDIRIAKWATDLHRSLRNERDRFDQLQRTDRAQWLLERVGEEVSHGNIVASPGGSPRAAWAMVRRADEKQAKERSCGTGRRYTASVVDSRDPLGLCGFGDRIRTKGFVLVKVLGGISVLGAIVVAVVRAFGVEGQTFWWGWGDRPQLYKQR